MPAGAFPPLGLFAVCINAPAPLDSPGLALLAAHLWLFHLRVLLPRGFFILERMSAIQERNSASGLMPDSCCCDQGTNSMAPAFRRLEQARALFLFAGARCSAHLEGPGPFQPRGPAPNACHRTVCSRGKSMIDWRHGGCVCPLPPWARCIQGSVEESKPRPRRIAIAQVPPMLRTGGIGACHRDPSWPALQASAFLRCGLP